MNNCQKNLNSLRFVLDVLGGKWKIHILSILYYDKKRFKELEREILGISARMLSKELRDLEEIGVINRATFNTVPITVEYSLTQEGLTLKPVLEEMMRWSEKFRKGTGKMEVTQQ
ncbi:helix-turn-helix domain-containing protein [Chryseolinea sp. H1M3-3]|uniref:winged helix-turn-helix transcriptional regulator n=1 Tax=Chryseolinea sp. H1M3-3 TaxID=3034144 RepID=UPI0023ED2B91|nr:helix-turn-helix domain-containing protein [Chryseolinea sp. H1M3-3]